LIIKELDIGVAKTPHKGIYPYGIHPQDKKVYCL